MLHYILDKKYNALFKNYIAKETPYNFQEVIGFGSYGVAYLIVHQETGNHYVLKRMKSKHKRNEKSKLKFHQEIDMLKALTIPNVPSISYEGQLEDIPFYIMDYVDGATFEQAIFNEGKTFSLEKALIVLKDLLVIIISIHKKGIVHRDLRIPNILLKNDQLYIIDFGLAAYIREDVDIETIDNPKKAENHCSDLYYIGHFLLYLLYSNYSPTQRKERSWQEELQLPIEVEEYIERLLLIRPAFSSAEEALNCIPNLKEAQL